MANKTLEELLQSSSVEDMCEVAKKMNATATTRDGTYKLYFDILTKIAGNFCKKIEIEDALLGVPLPEFICLVVWAGKTLDEVKGLLGWLGFKEEGDKE